MAASTNLSALLERLVISDNPSPVLQEIKLSVQAAHPAALQQALNHVSFAPVFQKLDTNDREQLELCCDILERCLLAMPIPTIFQHMQESLYQGFRHPQTKIREMCLRQFARCKTEAEILLLLSSPELLKKIILMIADKELSVAETACKVIVTVGSIEKCRAILFSNQFLEDFKTVMAEGDVNKFRVYGIVVKISEMSAEGLRRFQQIGFLKSLLDEWQSGDVLLQLNCLEFLSDLATTPHGLAYLDQQGILAQAEAALKKLESDPMASLLLPGLMKFFGHVCYHEPKAISDRYPTLLPLILSSVTSADNNLRNISIETVGLLTKSIEGKRSFNKYAAELAAFFNCLRTFVRDSPTEMRVRSLQALTSMLTVTSLEEQSSEIVMLMESWYRQFHANPMDVFMAICHQPFPDLRCAALSAIKAIASQQWGQQELQRHPGFLEHLLDRTTEPEKEGKEAKFAIVDVLVNSPTAQHVFGNPTFLKLKAFHREGPFYVPVQAQVATDGS